MSSTSAHDLTSWSLLLKTITHTLIDMVDSSTSSQFPSITKVQRKSLAGPEDRRFKSSGYTGLKRIRSIRMVSPIFESLNFNSLNKMTHPSGTVLYHAPMSYGLLTSYLPLHGTSWILSPVWRILMQFGSSETTGIITMLTCKWIFQ